LLGSLTTISFSPYNLSFVNFFTFSVLLYLIFFIKKNSNHSFFYLGCAFGFGFFLCGNYWISISLTHDDIFKGLIPFALILIPLFLSLFFGLAILIIGPFAEQKIFFIFYFSIVFSIFEFLRGNLLTGFPWNLISYTWSWSSESIQVLSIIGSYSLSLISITLFSIPFLFFKNKILKKNIFFTFIILILCAINYFYGL
jgi:apolipoprotein N-acyltransferase